MSESKTKIRVLLADDHVIVREGIRRLLESAKDIEVVAEAGLRFTLPSRCKAKGSSSS